MDFHSLTRRELQALCKKNKIPANMTNVAMADALKALQHVEGIDEFTNPSEFDASQSPGKPVSGSPDISHTVCRTSTRRRPIQEEPESSQPLTQTRRGTSRRIAGEAEEGKKDVLATSAVPSSRKSGAVALARRKMEIKEASQMESSVQRVYSTRHSVRLAEKKVVELSLKVKGRTEPIKIDDLSDNSKPVQENKGADSQTISSEEGLERSNVSDVVFTGKSDELQENSSDLKDEVKENSNCEVVDLKEKPEEGSGLFDDWEVVSIADEISNKLIDKERNVEDEARDDKKEADLRTKQEVGCQRTDELDESDVQLGELSEKTVDLNEEIIEKNGPNDFPVTIVLSDAEKLNEVLISENEQDMNVDRDMDSDNSSKIEISGHDASNTMDLVTPQSSLPQEINNSTSVVESLHDLIGDFEKPDLNSLNLSTSADQNVIGRSDEDGGLPEEQIVCSEQLGIEKEPKFPEFLGCEKSEEDSNQLENATDAISSDTTVDTELGSDMSMGTQVANGFSVQESMDFDSDMASYYADKLVMTTAHECPPSDSDAKDTDEIPFSTLPADPHIKDNNALFFFEVPIPETWVDVHEIGAEQTATRECPPSLDKTPASSVKQMSSFSPPVSDAKAMGEIPTSNWAVDPVLGHIPRPPTQLSPSKSSSKEQTTIQRMTHVSDNKENIDNSGRKVGSKTEKAKKIRKDTAEDSLHQASLRQLTKMLKERLQIRNKMSDNDDNKYVIKQVVKTRPALQMLTENCMGAAGEAKNEE